MSYITMSGLGQSGGLCSQLQTYASLLSVAKANGKEVVFSDSMLEGNQVMYHTGEYYQTKIRVFDLLELGYKKESEDFFKSFEKKQINFHTTTYDETLFNLDENKNYDLQGRFDLYTYWYDSIGEEVAAWDFKEDLKRSATKRYEEIVKSFGNDNQTVSIHVRLGDYLLPNHHFCNLLIDSDYYSEAVRNYFSDQQYNFIVFSNNVLYCKEVFEGDNVRFVEPVGGDKVCSDSEKEDLALMSMFDHHITANSSYSWWGAFLCKNKNKRVICPTNWLKSYHPSSWINGNYYPPTWINIDNKA